MTKFLRTVSTQRLLATLAGVVIAIAGGSAIAVAASSGGPVPRAKPLAKAVHGALSAPAVKGISARVTYTNNLIDSSDIQGPQDPLLQGASGRLWFSPSTHQLRLELQSDNGDAQAVLNGRSFWAYDPSSKTVYEGTLPAQSQSDKAKRHKANSDAVPSVKQIQSDLSKLAQHLDVSGAIPSDVAGQPAYTVQVSPKQNGGLVGDAQLAWDALRGVPLRFALYARGSSAPVIEVTATDISFGSVPSSDFAISPPSGSKVVKVSAPGQGGQRGAAAKARHSARRARQREVTGVAAVSRRLPFSLSAPSTAAGMSRQSVTLLDWGGHAAALVTYGQGLGGIAVVEHSARAAAGSGQSAGQNQSGDQGQNGDGSPSVTLPTVSINGASGQELATALGTMITFTSGNVSYTVLGSVSPATAEAAARAL